MSQDTDRIPVSTNGRGRRPEEVEREPSESVPRAQTVSFTPNQLAAGFGIVAGLLLLFAGARRRGRSGRDE